MIILLDTSTPLCRLTIVSGGTHVQREWEAGRTLAKELLGFLERQLAEQQVTLADIKGIGAFEGPGSFTGLRIGLTVLNTLADSLGVPIIGARGESWQQIALSRLQNGENDHLVMPHYGAEAHITTPRK